MAFVWLCVVQGFTLWLKNTEATKSSHLLGKTQTHRISLQERDLFLFSCFYYPQTSLPFVTFHLQNLAHCLSSSELQAKATRASRVGQLVLTQQSMRSELGARKALGPSGFAQPSDFPSKYLSCYLLFLGPGSILTSVVKTTAAVFSPHGWQCRGHTRLELL